MSNLRFAMELQLDEDLVEGAVFLCARGGHPEIAPLQIRRFHFERERLYTVLDPDRRQAAFVALHLAWFREWGLEDRLRAILRGCRYLSGAVAVMAFRKARDRRSEGADLFVNEAGRRHAVVALQPDRFGTDAGLRSILDHELLHLEDMVDPEFGYAPDLTVPGRVATQQQLARDRYRLLWDITIDGRLTARRGMASAPRALHQQRFDRAFSFWPEPERARVFAGLWADPRPRHERLAEFAVDPRGRGASLQPSPGGLCPLCAFPTFDWVAVAPEEEWLATAVRDDFPGWSAKQGLCRRCHEAYQALSWMKNRSEAVSVIGGNR